MARTPFYEIHKRLNAKIVDFAGFEMPVEYSGIKDEHMTVRNDVGVFDVSHMGEFFVSGKDASKFLNFIVPQSIEKMAINKVLYCQFTNEDAGIIDDLLIYKIS